MKLPGLISAQFTLFAAVLLTAGTASAANTVADAQPSADSATSKATSERAFNQRMAWWREAKFGMFIHWGVYSLAGGEWKGDTRHAEWLQFTAKIPIAEYTAFAKTFNPTKFDADQWAATAARAGMKYLVITSKHHDGFAMYDSPSDPYNIVKGSAFARDPLKELAAACRKYGLKFCVYYSLGRDWHDPDVPTGTPGSKTRGPGSRSNLVDFPDESKKDFARYFERKVKPQVRELLTQYGPIGVMWFDTPEKVSRAQSDELLKLIRSIQPECIVNVRIGNGLGDYGTPEQEIPAAKSSKPWETCMTLNNHWGYNKADANWKSTEDLLRKLVDISSKGGNFLLNVGPTGEGLIPQPSIERLEAIGKWMKVNGESIYGCGPTPFGAELGSPKPASKDKNVRPVFDTPWQWRATTAPGRIYLHVFEWPASRQLTIPAPKDRVRKAYLLAEPGKPLAVKSEGGQLTVTLPEQAPDAIDSVVRLDLAAP